MSNSKTTTVSVQKKHKDRLKLLAITLGVELHKVTNVVFEEFINDLDSNKIKEKEILKRINDNQVEAVN
ncbi:MAG: hypothetical protein IT280_12775 [Ignavibacteria bacterium]|nr:hypothetical protein [Ignavibacteria bacterium]